jgi:hypothetical protein
MEALLKGALERDYGEGTLIQIYHHEKIMAAKLQRRRFPYDIGAVRGSRRWQGHGCRAGAPFLACWEWRAGRHGNPLDAGTAGAAGHREVEGSFGRSSGMDARGRLRICGSAGGHRDGQESVPDCWMEVGWGGVGDGRGGEERAKPIGAIYAFPREKCQTLRLREKRTSERFHSA